MVPPVDKDRFWLLVGLKLDNEASEGELRELEQMLLADPGLKDQLDKADQVYQFKTYPLQPQEVDRAFSRHMQRLSNHLSRREEEREPKAKTGRILRLTLAAAGIAASVLLVVFVSTHYTRKEGTNVISTRFGSKSKIQLPDGTQVWLNADSKLTYNEDFGNQTREVSLSGEAFFDVQKDVEHPFIIHTSALDIKVLGTAFHVRSYQDEATAQATLIRGAIEVTLTASPERKILMKPSDMILVKNNIASLSHPVDSAGTIYSLEKVDIQEKGNISLETEWKKNSLAFRNETLEDVAGRIEHWFNVKVLIEDEELKKGTYSCDFRDESLKQVLEALHLTGRFEYQITKDSVIITK